MTITSAVPAASSAIAIAAAISGCSSENAVTAATSPSSVRLATMLVTGSGEALIPRRTLALIA